MDHYSESTRDLWCSAEDGVNGQPYGSVIDIVHPSFLDRNFHFRFSGLIQDTPSSQLLILRAAIFEP
jgi:hypothetical protein